MLAGGETVRELKWRKGVLTPIEQARVRGIADEPLEPLAFSDIDLQCAIMKHVPGGTMLTVDGLDCDFAFTVTKRGFPLNRLESMPNPFSVTNSPVFRHSQLAEVLAILNTELHQPLLLRGQALDGKLLAALNAEPMRHLILESWERAVLNTSGSFADWIANNFDHKRRKELKRLRNRLSEQGKLETERLKEESQLGLFIEDLLRLENEGWKGVRGTSVLQSQGHEAALREGLLHMFRAGKLRFWRMTLDGIAIASLFAVVDNGQATLGKIAHDEKLSKYSPGQLVIIDATQDFFEDHAINLADSNAIPNHPMINHLWRDRARFADIMIAPDGVSNAAFRFACTAEQSRRLLRNVAKTAYYRYKGERPS